MGELIIIGILFLFFAPVLLQAATYGLAAALVLGITFYILSLFPALTGVLIGILLIYGITSTLYRWIKAFIRVYPRLTW